MTSRILNAQGILSSDMPTGNLLWVDAVNGVDALARRGRMTIPFRTLTAAKNAAITPAADNAPRDTIVVMPGIYNDYNLLKNKVNWLFLPKARVETEAGAIFDTSVFGTSGPVQSVVAGWGEFRATNSTLGHVIYSAASGSNLVFEAQSMMSYEGCIVIGSTSGTLRVQSTEILSASYAIYVGAAGAANHIATDFIQASAGIAIAVEDGSIEVSARRIQASNGPAILVSGGSGSTVINAREVVSTTDVGVRYLATSAALRLINARIQAGGTTGPTGRAVDIDVNPGPATSLIRLDGCTLLAASAGDYSIRSSSSPATKVQGTVVANEDKHPTSIVFMGHWAFNEDVA